MPGGLAMKLRRELLLVVLSADIAKCSRVRIPAGQNAFIQHVYKYANSTVTSLRHSPGGKYGSVGCQCIGINNVDGTTDVKYEGKEMTFPADAGARCETWDRFANPTCTGCDHNSTVCDDNPWCMQKWCYVDPCTCSLEVAPKPSLYMEHATYQGKPLYFSYATCGATDEFSSDEHKQKAQESKDHKFCAAPHDAKFGDEKCKCIGIDGQEGLTKMEYNGTHFELPADVGASCSEWEAGVHPECKADKVPDWCHQPWCYVDPCSCGISTPSKHSAYLPHASFRDRPVHYSYATCKGTDSWSTEAMKKQAAANEVICEPHGSQEEPGPEPEPHADAKVTKSGARSATAAVGLALAGASSLLQ